MFGKTIVALVSALLLAGCDERPKHAGHDRLRIVAMAPNVAEILYAIGLSNEVVGVSRFTTYPPDARNKPVVGGLYDPNWERIVALQPDRVIGLKTQSEIAGQLKLLDIDFLGVSHEHIDEILQSILTIGKACGAEVEAQRIFQTLENSLYQLQQRNASFVDPPMDRPRVLVCVGHDEHLSRLYIAARRTFYDELIERAGGVNACVETTIKYPEISTEGLAAMRPDVVIDIFPTLGKNRENISRIWTPFCKKVTIISNDYASIPGTRFVLLLEDFANAIRQNNLEAE